MLRSNPEYLGISFEAKQGEGVADIVRVERNPADPSLIRELSTSRMQKIDEDGLMKVVAGLETGDVKFSLDPRARNAKRFSDTERLSVATPVYSDITGECFGMTVIETDVSKRIMDVLLALGSVECELFIGDGSGHLWASVDPRHGVRLARPGQLIPNLPERVVEQLSKPGEPFELQGDEEYVAKRFYIDTDERGVLIFARLPEDN